MKMSDLSFNSEPTAWVGFIRALIYLGILFGLSVTESQMAGIIVVLETGSMLINRREVTPNRDVATLTPEAKR